jgi:uncharacterized membrane protein
MRREVRTYDQTSNPKSSSQGSRWSSGEHSPLASARIGTLQKPVSNSGSTPAREAEPSLVTTTHVVYALHALSILIGAMSAAFIVTAFVFSIPSIVAVIINYVRKQQVHGTFLESHFRWQIRTFWFALLWIGVGLLLALTVIGIPFAWSLMVVVGLWVTYRIAAGWLALRDRRPMYG